MEKSKIEWCDATVNMWWGCTKVSPGCAHCYADTLAHRWGKEIWGSGKPREDHRVGATKLAMKLEQAAAEERFRECSVCGKREVRKLERMPAPKGLRSYSLSFCTNKIGCPAWPVEDSIAVRPRVFSASMSDWLDDEVPVKWLADLLALIHATPNLDWLLLSKRPQNWFQRIRDAKIILAASPVPDVQGAWRAMTAWLDGTPPSNIWIGTTVEDQPRADERIPELLKIPAKVRFLSCEPLLGPVDLSKYLFGWDPIIGGHRPSGYCDIPKIRPNWIIAGGESGPGARPMHPEWARGLRDQCQAARVPFLFKQWGDWAPMPSGGLGHVGKKLAGRQLDGREWNEFPAAMV